MGMKEKCWRGAGTGAGKNGGAGRSAGTGADRLFCLCFPKGPSMPALVPALAFPVWRPVPGRRDLKARAPGLIQHVLTVLAFLWRIELINRQHINIFVTALVG